MCVRLVCRQIDGISSRNTIKITHQLPLIIPLGYLGKQLQVIIRFRTACRRTGVCLVQCTPVDFLLCIGTSIFPDSHSELIAFVPTPALLLESYRFLRLEYTITNIRQFKQRFSVRTEIESYFIYQRIGTGTGIKV